MFDLRRFVVRSMRAIPAAVLLSIAQLPAASSAQRVDVVRGRVFSQDSTPVAGATVMVTDTTTKTPHPTRTDPKGLFSVSIENGGGTYFVAVTMLGFAPQRRFVSRGPDGAIPALEFKMSRVAAQLGAVRTVGARPKTMRSDVTGEQSIGGQTSYQSLSNGLTGDLTGDLTSVLSNIPGITVIPSPTGGLPTVSAFGVGGDQNGLVLNGMGFGGNVPRDGIRLAVVSSTYDPGRGGFAGVQLSLRMNPGSNTVSRLLHGTLDAPSLQYTTPVASQVAGRYGQQILSGAAAGPIILDHVFYSGSFQFQRRASGLTSLLSADPASLTALRISPDSVARLINALGPAGIPVRTAGVPSSRENIETRVAARIDWVPHLQVSQQQAINFFSFNNNTTQDAYYLQMGGTARTNDGAMIGPMAVPSFGGQQTHRDGWAQLTAAKYLPKSILNETTLSLNASSDRVDPYLDLPAARILVASTLPDSAVGISTVQVGGNSTPRSLSQGWSTEVRNQTSWNTWDRRHSIALTMSAAEDGYSIRQDAGFGSFAFNSLADFTNDIPASFSRTLTGRTNSGRGLTGAVGLGDTYETHAPSATGQQTGPVIQYGMRIEGNRLGVRPEYNRQVDSVFALRTDRVPQTLSVMPMLGFRWPLLAPYRGASGINFGPRGTLSGGIREYRGSVVSRSIDSYTRQTGLADAIQQLYCVGSASPSANWQAYEQAIGAIPTACANGTAGDPLAQTTPPIALFAPDYQLFESWRPTATFDYTLSQQFRTSITGTYTLNRNIPSQFDVNFNPAARFTLPAEGNRPVYVSPSSIVPATGTAAWTESRLSPLFAHVAESRSDLHGETRTLGGTLNYFPFLAGASNYTSVGVGYTFSDSREQYRGFTGTTDGDPTTVGWARGQQARHVITMNVNEHIERLGNLALFGRIQSGIAFTPSVAGDINGDGYSNDRAYIFNPAQTADTNIANPIGRLLASSPSAARTCLARQLGTVAGRASCVGPWAMTNLSLSITPDPYRIGLGNRGNVSLYVNNILSGLDQALHGASDLHGWGQPAYPDPTLLTVRGFDPATQQFKYTVNPQFGNTSVFRNTFRAPFTLTLDFRMDVAPDRETQYLEALLLPRKADGVRVFDEKQIKQRIARGFNPIDQLVLLKDSLELTEPEIDSMRQVSQRFLFVRDSVAGSVAKFLAERQGDYSGEDVRRVWHRAGIATYTSYLHSIRAILAVFTPEQLERAKRLPQTAGLVLNVRTIQDRDLPWMFRSPLPTLP